MSNAAETIVSHVPRMYRVALRMLADDDMAHEVVQEACVKALSKLDTFKGEAALSTWLHRITVNCANDVMRSDARDRNGWLALKARPVEFLNGESPDEAAEMRELSAVAWKALDTLPEGCRSAFMLTQLDGYSYDEVAEIEGQPRGTIASRVYRAKKLLLEKISAQTERRAKP
ncbi:MAG: RNA polymerase sigma factor [Phycisphaerae bacterium]|nr:RNA polymerase sigma factor [Phycisphaerae bacterium]